MRKLALAGLLVGAVVFQRPASAAPVFTDILAFAHKAGQRGVVAWQASEPVVGRVRYGTSPTALTRVATAVPASVPDTAGMAYLFEGGAQLQVGTTYYFQVEDALSGTQSSVGSFVAANAYNDWDGTQYNLDLVIQLDAPGAPVDVSRDLGLVDIAEGANVFAERLYDALDRWARVGRILITDTLAEHVPNTPSRSLLNCMLTGGNLADILIQTTVPLDSHTFGGWAIGSACTQVHIGRLGWLGTTWRSAGDPRYGTDLGFVLNHEFMHYGFNTPDLYSDAAGGPNCVNPQWDGSVMHNTLVFDGNRWHLTELDQDPVLTPCALDRPDATGGALSWDTDASWVRLRERYTNIPMRTPGPDPAKPWVGAIDHIIDRCARGHDDGGAMEIWILDREAGSSSLRRFHPNETPCTR